MEITKRATPPPMEEKTNGGHPLVSFIIHSCLVRDVNAQNAFTENQRFKELYVVNWVMRSNFGGG